MLIKVNSALLWSFRLAVVAALARLVEGEDVPLPWFCAILSDNK